MNRKILFLDIDGTLMDFHYFVPESTKRALKQAQERGVLCIINTGRPYLHIDPQIKALHPDGYICSCGMHVLLNGRTLVHDSLTKEQSRAVVTAARKYGMEVIYESEEGMYFDETMPMRDYLVRSKKHFGEVGVPVDKSIDAEAFCIDKFSAWTGPQGNAEAFLKVVTPFCHIVNRKGDLYECVKQGYSKATGMDLILAETGVPLEQCYAIGDSANDLSMLNYVPHSIAMGNADPEVKKACEYVTADLLEDGVEKALKQYELI